MQGRWVLRAPGQDEEQHGDAQVGRGHVDPHVQGERWQEGEQVGRLLDGLAVQYADACKKLKYLYIFLKKILRKTPHILRDYLKKIKEID